MMPSSIIKRDGRRMPFETQRVAAAIRRALMAVGQDAPETAHELAEVVVEHLARHDVGEVALEQVQDACQLVLQESGHYAAAVAFVRYRDARERSRRERIAEGDHSQAPNLTIVDSRWRTRAWDPAWLARMLSHRWGLSAQSAQDTVAEIERLLTGTSVVQLPMHQVLSLADAAMVRLGLHSSGERSAALRIDPQDVRAHISSAGPMTGLARVGRVVARQWSLSHLGLNPTTIRLWGQGRLWISGMDDPGRGARLTRTIDSVANPWQIMSHAFAVAGDESQRWQTVRLVLPPSLLGHLERGADVLAKSVSDLSRQVQVYLYCDGRTPLLHQWPFAGQAVSLASYNQDFILDQRLRELGRSLLSGPYLLDGSKPHHVLADLALNAQGLDRDLHALDELAMAAVSGIAARVRALMSFGSAASAVHGALRFAVYGLPHDADSRHYLDNQITQEAHRLGLTLERAGTLSEEACAHFGRLLDDPVV